MMEYVPILVDGGVVLNATNVCNNTSPDCKVCPDIAVGVHNWLVANNRKYLIIDFQDEKDVCTTMLVELLQLRKRLKFPFLLVGLMERPRQFLLSYAYGDHLFFNTPEDAIDHLRAIHPGLAESDMGGIEFDKPIPTGRFRGGRLEIEGEEFEEEVGPEI